ncbi:MAG: glycosyltransferase [Bacteroidales bacterium]|nr:glycosyltransferase [Bacteroidales bacterium]MDD4384279.1 glycosyltransferase [Bacteroidales bacterium]MDY0198576.1 glycosyltransferase [Tenuifilaceae bacterium]
MFHSYVLFPFFLNLFSKNKKQNRVVYSPHDTELPNISIIMSVHNEEQAIEKKINSLINTSYPKNRLSIVIGSDSSTDNTNIIVEKLIYAHPEILFYPFTKRQGKPNVINQLVKKTDTDILILTDAKVFFTEDTIFEMVKHFKNPEIAIVGANLVNNNLMENGITFQEKAFMSREIRMKHQEGLLWGSVIGAYGACFAIRKQDYTFVPKNYLVDDFFITMNVLKKQKKVIYELNSVCHESVPGKLKEEFRRKVRIATGNFQNLKTFSSMLFGPSLPIAYCFWSHKVIRWLGPFFIILVIVSTLFLQNIEFYRIMTLGIGLILLIPFIDFLLKRLNVNLMILRFVTHFFSMNIALLVGLIKYLKGVNSNVWKPTQRNH